MISLRFRSVGDRVSHVQSLLGLDPDGKYGRMTESAVKNFQLKNGLVADGIVGPRTYQLLVQNEASTDLRETFDAKRTPFEIYPLDPDEYVGEDVPHKKYIFLHHTAGWHNPYKTVDYWNNDKRGRIGTHFVIGGVNHRTGDNTYDGSVIQCIPDDNWAYHLGPVNRFMHRSSIGIELCSFGGLTEIRGKFYTYIDTLVHPSQVIELEEEFRGYRYYHRYSDSQIIALSKVLMYLSKSHSINLRQGLQELLKKFPPGLAFEYFPSIANGKQHGLLSHSNVKKSKSDVYPDPRLVDLINSF